MKRGVQTFDWQSVFVYIRTCMIVRFVTLVKYSCVILSLLCRLWKPLSASGQNALVQLQDRVGVNKTCRGLHTSGGKINPKKTPCLHISPPSLQGEFIIAEIHTKNQTWLTTATLRLWSSAQFWVCWPQFTCQWQWALSTGTSTTVRRSNTSGETPLRSESSSMGRPTSRRIAAPCTAWTEH